MPSVRIGLLLPTREVFGKDASDARPVLDLARHAERLGFDSVRVGDGVTSRPRSDPLTLLAAISATTSQVTLGTAVLLAPLRHPVLLAHQLTSLDLLAGGRLVLGLGSGFPTPDDYSAHLATVSAAATTHGNQVPEPALYATLALDDDADRAARTLDTAMRHHHGRPARQARAVEALYAGTPAGASDWLAHYARAGARHVVVRLAGPDPVADAELVHEHVMPSLRDLPEAS